MIEALTLEPSAQGPFITAIGAVCVALTGVVAELLRRHRKDVSEVKEQVANSHSTNLRDDLDRVLDRVGDVLKAQAALGEEMRGMREDLRQERTERLAVASRLDDHIRSTKE